jgi:uncharacterized protein YciI
VKFFVVLIHYTEPLETVAAVTPAHREFLDEGYARGWFLASGRRNPPVGGVLIARAPDRESLEALLARDPFLLQEVARHELIEFDPVKRHPDYAQFFGREG